MLRLDSSKGRCRCRCKLELSAMAARARRVRANPPETKARAKAKARTRTSTRAMTETRTRNATTWNIGQRQAKFQRYFSHCSKWGHKRADCRTRLAQQKNGAVAGVQEPDSEAGDIKATQWSDVDSEDVDMDSSSWCFAASNNPRGPAGTLCRRSHLPTTFCERISVEKECGIDTERRARQPIISARHPTRQSERVNRRTASKH